MKEILNTIANNPIYISIGIFATLSFIVTVSGVIIFAIKGGWSVLSFLLRLGSGLAKSNIAIFAKGDNLTSLKGLLENSGLFPNNFVEISKLENFCKVRKATLFLVFWDDWKDNNDIEEIIKIKENGIPLIIYAPPLPGSRFRDERSIPRETFSMLTKQDNTTVTNFGGRLLSDIFFSIITGS